MSRRKPSIGRVGEIDPAVASGHRKFPLGWILQAILTEVEYDLLARTEMPTSRTEMPTCQWIGAGK
jgi:hypothetical protein